MLKKILAAVFVLVQSLAQAQTSAPVLFQYSTIDALLAGAYDGDLTIAALSKKGDFGIGTYNRVDGEMTALNGVYYKIKADGSVVVADPLEKTPFATVTQFVPGLRYALEQPLSLQALEAWLDAKLSNKNLFYAIRFDGQFDGVTTRAIAPQTAPYKPLAEVVKTQSIFNFASSQGTLVGFRSPGFSKGFNVPGYHWHYLTHDRRAGGHVLAMTAISGAVQIAAVSEIELKLPATEGFAASDQTRDRALELQAVEKLRK